MKNIEQVEDVGNTIRSFSRGRICKRDGAKGARAMEGIGIKCDFCGEHVEEVAQCEICGECACNACVQSNKWSEKGHLCAGCAKTKGLE